MNRSLSGSAFIGLLLIGAAIPLAGQAPAAKAPAPGKPNLNGIWEAVGTANWDLQDHSAKAGPVWQMGALGAFPAGAGVIDAKEIPYQPAALAKKKTNAGKWPQEDPETKCYLPGIPRATYQSFPFQIVQSPTDILFVYEFAGANRLVNMGKKQDAGADSWMGTSNGHWEGKTLVVDVTGLNGLAWLDRAGDYTSDNVRVTERYTPIDKDHITYEATIDDSTVFTRPWKITLPLYRRIEKNAQLMEFKCVPFSEELLYGKYKKQGGD